MRLSAKKSNLFRPKSCIWNWRHLRFPGIRFAASSRGPEGRSSPHCQVSSTSIWERCCVSAKYTLPLPVSCNYAKYDVTVKLTLSDNKYHHDVHLPHFQSVMTLPASNLNPPLAPLLLNSQIHSSSLVCVMWLCQVWCDNKIDSEWQPISPRCALTTFSVCHDFTGK